MTSGARARRAPPEASLASRRVGNLFGARGAALSALLLAGPGFALGSIAGTVGFKGRAFKPVKVSTADPACRGATAGGERRAVVRITRNAPGGSVPAAPVLIEQKGCGYRPALQGAMRGQKLLFRNSDGTTHSIRAEAGGRALFNVIQPPGARDLQKDPLVAGLVTLSCDLHPWMKAFVLVSEHPFFALTAEDGTFAIEGVPAGSYGVEAWNDRLGVVRAEVRVEDGKAVDPKLTFITK